MSKHPEYIKTPLNGYGPSFVVADVEDVVVHCLLGRLYCGASSIASRDVVFLCCRLLSPKKHFYFSIMKSLFCLLRHFFLLLTLRSAGSIVFRAISSVRLLVCLLSASFLRFPPLSRALVPLWDPWRIGIFPILANFCPVLCSY